MQYLCDTRPLMNLSDSRAKSMCDLCKSRDCENPIESKFVSIIGVNRKMRVYVTRSADHIVTRCDGFVT